ncbi:desi2 [Symbiodinium pilosum]|uniref:Desi2 protein n=1 Tax=Symbiodinium pilosum TaxID=2952 RepID=A0A812WC62_SYMPI|nr:desi2 [Symbiodinium pilosum]
MKGSLGGALISLSMSWHLRLIECALNVSWGERKQEGEGKKGDKVEKPQVMMIHVLVLGLCLAISSSCWSGRAPGPSATTAEESTSVMEQIRSKKFLVILGFHMTMIFTYRCMLSFRYDELMWKKATFASSMDVQWQLDIFTVSQYSLNIFMIPVFAYVVEKFGHRQAPYLLCATLHLLWQCMRLVPGQWILPLFDLTTAMHRHAFASTHYMFLSAEFPTQVYARLIGIGHLVAAFVNLLPTPLLALVFWHFEGDFMVLLLSQLCIAVALFLITNLAWPFKPETEAEKNLEKLTA